MRCRQSAVQRSRPWLAQVYPSPPDDDPVVVVVELPVVVVTALVLDVLLIIVVLVVVVELVVAGAGLQALHAFAARCCPCADSVQPPLQESVWNAVFAHWRTITR